MQLTEPYSQLFVMLLGLFIALALASWVEIGLQLRRGQSPVPFVRRDPVPWGLGAILLFVVSLLAAVPALQVLAKWMIQAASWDPSEPFLAMVVFSASSLLAAGVTVAILRLLGATYVDVGFDASSWVEDAKLSVVSFGAVAVPVFGVQALLTKFWKTSEHPIVELIGDHPSAFHFGMMTVSAVIVAPVVEELFFRVLMQGWLENIAAYLALPEECRNRDLASRCWWGMRQMADGDYSEVSGSGAQPLGRMQPRPWPVVVSAALFASAHAGYGPDPIPLFFLALGLGYLYQRTHRALPCIMLHMMVNGTSMFMLWLLIRSGLDV